MKAIIVVDVEENGKYYADVYRIDDDDRFQGRHYLKPMPQKKEVNLELDYEAYYQIGWNDCLDEIGDDGEW